MQDSCIARALDERGGQLYARDERGGQLYARDERGGQLYARDERGGPLYARDERGGQLYARDERGGWGGDRAEVLVRGAARGVERKWRVLALRGAWS
jgi:hypothetical protein